MTLAGKLISLFPALVVAGALACLGWLIAAPGLWPAVSLVFVLYGLPLAAFRLHQALWPMKIGATHLAGRGYVRWYGTHQIQAIYLSFPALEAALRLVPGLFAAWLRLWGARIGKGVYFTPQFEITDRSLLEVGDNVIFGHQVHLLAHVIRPMKGNLLLYVKPICIETGAFVGAGSAFGPGVRVRAGGVVPVATHGYPNQELP